MATTYTYKKDSIGAADIKFKSSGTSQQSWSRIKSDGSTTQTIYQVDANDIQFRSVAKQLEDLVDGGYDVALTPQSVVVGGGHLDVYSGYNIRGYSDAGSTKKYDLDCSDGSVAHTISNDKYVAITKTESDIDTSSWTGYFQDSIYSNYIQPAHAVSLTVTHNDGGTSGSNANWTACYFAQNDVNLNSGTGHRYDNRCVGFYYDGHLQSPVYNGGAFHSYILHDSDHAYSDNDDKCDSAVLVYVTKVDGASRVYAGVVEGDMIVENCASGSSGNIGIHTSIRVNNTEVTNKDTKNFLAYGSVYANDNHATDGATYQNYYAEQAIWFRGRWNNLLFSRNNNNDTYDGSEGFSDTKIGKYAIDFSSMLFDTNAETMAIASGSKIILDGTAYDATHNYWISDAGVKTKHVYHPTTAKTTTATAAVTDCVFICTSASAWALTLPAVSGNAGLTYYIKKTDAAANAITITPTDGTIDGAASNTEINAQYDAMTIVCDGTNWHIVNKKIT